MNDQQNPYDPYYPQQPQIIGYDAYGQPVYQQQAPSPGQQAYDPYADQRQAYGYDAYAQPQEQQPQQPYDPYAAPQQGYAPQQPAHDPYDPYAGGQQGWQAPEPAAPASAAPAPAPAAPTAAPAGVPGQRPAPAPQAPAAAPRVPRPAAGDDDRDYRTEQFSFIEEPDEDSEDVIDWLKFTESRSERREEARRRGRNRVVALGVVLALAVVGGLGYLWSAGLLPGTGEPEQKQAAATGPQQRDTIVLHLHDTSSGATSTALLVDNSTTRQGTTVLLPNALAVADTEGATTTLGKSVEDDGSSGTREALGNLLGAKLAGTWRLDTPYLENLVEYLGGVDVDADTTIPDPKGKKGADPLVAQGEKQTLNGRAAVAYATHRGSGEAEAKQLQRFGQVVGGLLRKLPSDAKNATTAIEYLQQIADPSLPEKDLGASLAKLADHAKTGAYKTTVLPVGEDGSLAEGAGDGVVKDVLGGKVTAPDTGGVPRVSIKDASGKDATEAAKIVLINGGYVFVGGTKGDSQAKTEVVYADDAQKDTAAEVAKTLGLPASAAVKGKPFGTAAVTVVLGRDYEIPGAP